MTGTINLKKGVTMQIDFSSKRIKAEWVKNNSKLRLEHPTIVINIGDGNVTVSAPPDKKVHPRESVLLRGVEIIGGDSLLLVEIVNEEDIGGVILDPGWHQLGELIEYPKDVPLWKSSQYDLGTVCFDPYYATGSSVESSDNKFMKYKVKVNLWFAPAKTNCLIHNKHAETEILEVHTQIYGTGRMQKFHADNYASLYDEVIMGPGNTHLPFAGVNMEGQFIYPWHQYYSDTDCIWAANEFHPI